MAGQVPGLYESEGETSRGSRYVDTYPCQNALPASVSLAHVVASSTRAVVSSATLRPCDIPDEGQSSSSAASSTTTLRRPSSAPSLHRHVQDVLNARRRLDQEGEKYYRSMDFNCSFRDLEHSLQDVCSTKQYEEFCRRTKKAQSSNPGFSVKTFFDLRCYVGQNNALSTKASSAEHDSDFHNKRSVNAPTLHSAGGLMLVYAFYSQLYTFLKKVKDIQFVHGKLNLAPTKAEDMGLFKPIDASSTHITYLDVINMASDFEIVPQLISRIELQTIYGHVHPENSIDAKFVHSGLTLDEFTDLLVIIADVAYRYKRYGVLNKLQRVQQLIEYMYLGDITALKENLSNHWWRRAKKVQTSSNQVGQMVLRELNSVKPKGVLAALAGDKHIDSIADVNAVKALSSLTWLPQIYHWRAFNIPALDMGIIRIGTSCNFRMLVHNQTCHMMDFSLNLFPHVPALSPHTPDRLQKGVAPGAYWDVKIVAQPKDVSEWSGLIKVEGKNHNGEQYSIQIPAYLRSVEPNNKHPRAGLLPKKVPGSIHRRGDGAEALQRQDLTPSVLAKEHLGAALQHSRVARPSSGGALSQKKWLPRHRSHARMSKANLLVHMLGSTF